MPNKYNKKNITIAPFLCLCLLLTLALGYCSDDNNTNNSSKQSTTFAFPQATIEATVGDAMILDQIASGGTGTGAITYTSATTSVATVNPSTGAITIVGAGSTTITATRAVEANATAITAMYTLTIKNNDTLSFPNNNADFTANFDGSITTQVATATSRRTGITYASDTLTVATVDMDTGVVTIVGSGTTMITATLATDATYNEATASYTLNVCLMPSATQVGCYVTRAAAQDFPENTATNYSPLGLWSDGTTMWIVDSVTDKIYAYNLSTKTRDAAKDFDTLSAAGNTNPTGLWSDGMTMWVTDF